MALDALQITEVRYLDDAEQIAAALAAPNDSD